MSRWLIAFRSILYHKRINLAVALGVAAATAVLTGALIVGESMRGSLRDLTLDRLGDIDWVLQSPGFFSESLYSTAERETQTSVSGAGVLYFANGTVRAPENARQASNVSVLGVRPDFWKLYPQPPWDRSLQANEIVINQTLATDLGIDPQGASDPRQLTLRIPKPTLLPAESSLGEKDDLFESIVNLKIADVIPDQGPGRFSLHPSQLPPRIAFVSLGLLQDILSRDALRHKSSSRQVNMFLISQVAGGDRPSQQKILQLTQPTNEDLGLSVKRVRQTGPPPNQDTVFDYVSLSSDRLVIQNQVADSIRKVYPAAAEVLVYLAKSIRRPASDLPGIPFSIIAAIDFDESFQPVSAITGEPAARLADNEIALNEWAAEDLAVGVGDELEVVYFEPEATHGETVERSARFTIADILKLTRPAEPFQVTRRDVTPPRFDTPPTVINDPALTPEVPGLTDAKSIESWDLPFETEGIQSEDEDYWNYFRTTPKAFVSLAAGRRLWSSRFGDTTSFRIPVDRISPTGVVGGDELAQVNRHLRNQFQADGHLGGLQLIPIREQGLAAASGSTPFDVLFLMLSTFVIASALILVSLLFKLGIEQRSNELGVLRATGFESRTITQIWLTETAGICLVGSVVGALLGVGYAAAVLWGLRTFWVGAVTTPFLTLHLAWWNLPLGIVLGILVSVATIYGSIRRTARQSASRLLAGDRQSNRPRPKWRQHLNWIAGVLLLTAGACVFAASSLAGESQAMAFIAGGFCVLIALLIGVWQFLSYRPDAQQPGMRDILRLAASSLRRNALRSTLTIGLVAVAAFLIAAISAFHLTPTDAGTGGFDYLAQTSQPVFENLNSTDGQRQLLLDGQPLSDGSVVLPLRYRPGDDSSCNNLYQTRQPTVLGASAALIEHFEQTENGFGWALTAADSPETHQNPWQLLTQPASDDGAIPVVIDKNTAWYSLKIYMLGEIFDVEFNGGQQVKFKLVGLLDNTVLQGSLIIGEEHFKKAFPDLSGYRYFLVQTSRPADDLGRLSEALADHGFEARSAPDVLANYLAVQNTYLNTFQSLGALGLLLGTLGLVAVQLRNVFERRQELAVMRSLGYSFARLASVIMLENVFLLTAGLVIGIAAALFATVPFVAAGQASLPWLELLVLTGVIGPIGLLASWLAARNIRRLPLLNSLRI